MVLRDIREKINEIDDQLLKLFDQRYQLTDEVGRVKAATGDPVNIPEREKEIYKKVSEEALIGDMIQPVWRTMIRVSKSREYDICFEKVVSSEMGEAIKQTYQGVEGLVAGKKPVLAVTLAQPGDVVYFLNIVHDEGFYPTELKLSDLQCTCLFDILDSGKISQEKFIAMLYKLCNEFADVRLMGWV